MAVTEAIEFLRKGRPVIVFDSERRERESDFFVGAEFCQPADILLMRSLGGGVLFLAVAPEIGRRFGLVHLEEFYRASAEHAPVLQHLRAGDLRYDSRAAFSFSLNHRSVFTGVTDIERALTSRRFAELALETRGMDDLTCQERLGLEFRTPGHVQVCVAAEGLFKQRVGHTELGAALSLLSGLSGVCLGCEILHESGEARTREQARELAQELAIPFIDGQELVQQGVP